MGQRAEKIWEAFKGELVVEPTDDMREALATSIREIMNEYEEFIEDDGYGNMVVKSQELYNLANELDT
jgi:hypothetical protein